MPFTRNQRGFIGGEFAPELYGKSDIARHAVSAKLIRNFDLDKTGAAWKEPGSQFITSTKNNQAVNLLPFKFSESQAYVLEFGEGYIRIIQDGALVTVGSPTAWANATFYFQGDSVSNGGINYYCIADHTGDTSANQPGSGTNWHNFWYQLTGNILEIPTSYAAPNIPTKVNLFQSFDVLTILSLYYAPAQLTRLSATQWTYTKITFLPSQIPSANNISAVAGAGTANDYQYLVTTVNAKTGEESFPGSAKFSAAAKPCTGIVPLSSTVSKVACVAHGFSTNDVVLLSGFTPAFHGSSSDPVNGLSFVITVTDVNHFTILVNSSPSGIPPNFKPSYGAGNAYGNPANVITFITHDNPCAITTSGVNGLVNGDLVWLDGTGISQLDARVFSVTTINTTSFYLNGVDSTTFDPSASPVTGAAYPCNVKLSANTPTAATPNVVSWNKLDSQPSDQAVFFNVYISLDGFNFGYIGSSYTNSFPDTGVTPPDFSHQPPIAFTDFSSPLNFPSIGAIYQQRGVYANWLNNPRGIAASRIGFHKNLTYRNPLQDDDAIRFTLDSQEQVFIKSLLANGVLVAMTDVAEHPIGSQVEVLTPTNINAQPQTFSGSSDLQPLFVGKNILFTQAMGNQVRALSILTTPYAKTIDENVDVSIFASHLLKNNTLVRWDYQKLPDSKVWGVRDDGKILKILYIPDQEANAWTRHDTLGYFEDVLVIPENGRFAVYVLTRRTIEDTTVRYIERYYHRFTEESTVDDVFSHSSKTYDGRNTTAMTMTLTGTNFDAFQPLNLEASDDFFETADENSEIHFYDEDGKLIIRASIVEVVDAQNATVRSDRDVPETLQDEATTVWAHALNQMSGLDHLNGENVMVVGDSFVVNNPNHPDYKQIPIVVDGGVINLKDCYAVIHVGLPYFTDMQTLPGDNLNGETWLDKNQNVSKVAAMVVDSLPFFIGPPPLPGMTDLEIYNTLVELKQRQNEGYDSPIANFTGVVQTGIKYNQQFGGEIFVRSIQPTRLIITNLAPYTDINPAG